MDNDEIRSNTASLMLAKQLLDPGSIANGQRWTGFTGQNLYKSTTNATIATDANTKSVVAVMSPQISQRNGQHNIVIYERNNSGQVISTSEIPIGPELSTVFDNASVVTATLSAQNVNGSDSKAGKITSTVLRDANKRHALLSTSELATKTREEIVVVDAYEGVRTFLVSEDCGKKSVKIRKPNETKNLFQQQVANVERTKMFFDATGNDVNGFADGTVSTGSDIVFFDTGLLKTAAVTGGRNFSEFFIQDHVHDISLSGDFGFVASGAVTGAIVTVQVFNDHDTVNSPTPTASHVFNINADVANTEEAVFAIPEVVLHSTTAIARVKVLIKAVGAGFEMQAQARHLTLDLITETADIPSTPTGIIIVEGLKGGDSLSFAGEIALVGSINANNAILDAPHTTSDTMIDVLAIERLLLAICNSVPKAMSISEYESFLNNLVMDFGTTDGLAAFSFGSVVNLAKRIKNAFKRAKGGYKKVKPFARGVLRGANMIGVPGSGLAMAGLDTIDAGLAQQEELASKMRMAGLGGLAAYSHHPMTRMKMHKGPRML